MNTCTLDNRPTKATNEKSLPKFGRLLAKNLDQLANASE